MTGKELRTNNHRIQKVRHKQILDVLRSNHAMLVRDLANQIGVSESTIRRDLEELQGLDILHRVHGGAVLQSDLVEPPFETRQITNALEKTRICRLAAATVRNGEVIFIDGGTTAEHIVPFLAEKRDLTVVTCGLNTCIKLRELPHIHTIVVGGELHIESQSFTGAMALEALNNYGIRCDRAFIGAGGVSARFGVTNRILDRVPIKQRVMQMSSHNTVVVDSSKIGVATLRQIAPMASFDQLITNANAPQEEVDAIRALGVTVALA
jgi:DeoR/GlpR family transcriptional regulator of sugar metabolism